MQSYQHITLSERESLWEMRKSGLSIRQIARILKRHPSSISRELKRNKTKRGYTPYWALSLYLYRRKKSRRKQRYLTDSSLIAFTKQCLERYWSPETIVAQWKQLHPGAKLSAATIYRALALHLLEGFSQRNHLRRRGVLKYKKGNTSPIQNERRINERPRQANLRLRIGDWEGDTIWGLKQKSYLVTCVDRKSRFLLAAIVENKSSQTVNAALQQLLGGQPLHSLTLDRGAEFAAFDELERSLKTQVFFADPHAPWQRGSNENINGLLRFFFPRGTDFSSVSKQELDAVLSLINSRPRKCLDWLSPSDLFLSKCCS